MFNNFYGVFGEYNAADAIAMLDLYFGLDSYNCYYRDFVHLMSIGAALDHQRASGSKPDPRTNSGLLHKFALWSESGKHKQLAFAYNNMIRDPMT